MAWGNERKTKSLQELKTLLKRYGSNPRSACPVGNLGGTPRNALDFGAGEWCRTDREATLTKLHFLLSQDLTSDEIRQLMKQNLRGELTPD